MRHDLKTWPEYFAAVKRGDKPFEVRVFDRPFAEGDTLLLQEYDPASQAFTGDTLACEVTYVLAGGQFGVEQGHCVMGIKAVRNEMDNKMQTNSEKREALQKWIEQKRREFSRKFESTGSVSQRLIEAEDILSDLSTGYWVATLDDADAPVNEKMGQRVLNYWKKRTDQRRYSVR